MDTVEQNVQAPLTAGQCRAGRGLLGWSQVQLASVAKVARGTLISFETGGRTPTAANLAAIQAALEAAGVEFIAQNGGGPGVRLRKA